MAQKHLIFGDYTAPDPDEDGYVPAFATTSTENSGRTQRGNMINTPMFTVVAYNLKWTDLKASVASSIIKQVLGKASFRFYHFDIITCTWKWGDFYVANIDPPFYRLSDGEERVSELSFQVTAINPV